MHIESNNQVMKGKRLFIVIVIASTILQLAPALLAQDFLVSRLIFPIAGVILYSFLAYNTYQGHKWARIILAMVYLATLLFSIPMVLYLISSFRLRGDFILIAYEAVSICFVLFCTLSLLRSKSLIAFLHSNQIRHQEGSQFADNASGTKIANQSKVLSRLKNIQVHQVILSVGVFILFTQYIWKFLYIGGVLPGAYWLFHYLDKWFFASIKFTFISAGVIFLLWLLSRFFFKQFSPQLINIVGAFIVTGAAIVLTFPMILARNTIFIEQLHAENRVYYLSAYPLFSEVNYSVAECEFTGQICRTIFISDDITGTDWRRSRLQYDAGTREIMLIEDDEGLIFSKELQ